MVLVTSPLIRPMVPGDLDAMKEVIRATGLFPAALLEGMVTGDSDPGALWLVAERAELTALAYVAPERMTAGTWNLLLIAVHPDHQETGVGSALIARVELAVRDRGAHLLLVETSGQAEFAATRRFYQQRGFTPEARIRDYYQPGDDKIVLRKSWPPE